MLRVVSCLTTQHDWRLVLLAGLLCLLTSIVAMSLFERSRATLGGTRLLWLITTSTAAGFGIWATHFIAMLAFSPGLPFGYDLPLTLISLLAAIVMTGAGFAIATGSAALQRSVAAGVVVGLGIAIMHYTGMAAFEVPGHIEWAYDLVAASIMLGCLFSIAAILVAQRLKSALSKSLAPSFLALAIIAHHFTGMGAVTIAPDLSIAISPLLLSPYTLAIAVSSAAAALLVISFTVAYAEHATQKLIDASDERIALQARYYEIALKNMTQGVCLFDSEKRIVVANPRYAEIYGLGPETIEPGTHLRKILETRAAMGRYDENFDAEEYVEMGVANFQKEVSEILPLSGGRSIAVLRKPLPDGGLISTHEDITERRRAEEQLAYLAQHDALTDLPNRVLMRERLQQAITTMQDGGRALAVLLLDLDLFKEVNDTLGHPTGDALLQIVAKRLSNCLKKGDTVARLGGDEFAIIQKLDDPATDSAALAKRVLKVIGQPFELDGHRVSISTSIGIAISPSDGDLPDTLIKHADLALYHAKAKGGETYSFFDQEMERRIRERRALEADLSNALTNGEFALLYQPILNLECNEIRCFEALVRWYHPERGEVPPLEFVPLAEETGLIVRLGEWVLRQACTDAAAWPEHVTIAVNLSPAQFRSQHLAEMVVRTLASTGLPAQRLELEVTESVMLSDEKAASDALWQLHDIGVRLALDDFGTGYSSLSVLRKFPFNKLKIDRSFVSELSAANTKGLVLVRSVAQLGAGLGMSVTAEGVETADLMSLVRAQGCTNAQGHYVGLPIARYKVERLLDIGNADRGDPMKATA